jgi:hypothetical protein
MADVAKHTKSKALESIQRHEKKKMNERKGWKRDRHCRNICSYLKSQNLFSSILNICL